MFNFVLNQDNFYTQFGILPTIPRGINSIHFTPLKNQKIQCFLSDLMMVNHLVIGQIVLPSCKKCAARAQILYIFFSMLSITLGK